MNIFSKVTLQSLKKNRTRTIVTIIGIMLSTALICAVTTSIASVWRYAVNYYEYTDGKWHGHEECSDIGMYNKIKSSDKIEGAGCLSYIGYADIGSDNEYKPYLYICGFEENMKGLIPVHITSGRFPENRNEILIPDHLYSNGGVDLKEGDKITLDIGNRRYDADKMVEAGIDTRENVENYPKDDDSVILTQANSMTATDSEDNVVISAEYIAVKETREFTVVGTYERPDFEYYFTPGYTALTVPDSHDENTIADIYYRMNKAKDIYDFKKEYGLVGENHSDILMLSGVSRYESFYAVVFGLASIVIGLIMFGSIMLIYNAFSISVSERTKQFGLLSSIGATKKQLKKMVKFESLALSVIGIPLGIILGIAGMWITFLAIGSRFTSFSDNKYPEPLRVYVTPIAIIAAVIIAFVTIRISAWIPSKRATKITAVEAIRQNEDIKQKKYIKTPKIISKLFGLPGTLAHKYFKRSKKRYRATIISLFMSIVLFVSAYSFTVYLVGAVNDTHHTWGMDYEYYIENTKSKNIDPDRTNELIKSSEHITDSAYVFRDNYWFCVDKKYVSDEAVKSHYFEDDMYKYDLSDDAKYFYSSVYFVEDNAFRRFAEECGLNADEYMDPSSPKGIFLDDFMTFDYEKEKMVRVKLFDKEDFDVKTRQFEDKDGYFFYEINEDGKAEYRGNYDPDTEEEKVKTFELDECSRELTFHIGAVTDKDPYFKAADGMVILYPYSCCGQFYEKDVNDLFNEIIYYIKSDDVYEGFDTLQKTLKENGLFGGNLYNYADEAESNRDFVVVIKVFAYGFIVLISLIAAANVFNTITTNINLRRREFAMLKSVGMTAKGMNKMMNFECIMYGTKALIYGLPVSAGVTFLIYRAINEGIDTDFFIPWRAVIIAVLSVFIVVFSTMMYSMSKIKKDNPIDALKNENI